MNKNKAQKFFEEHDLFAYIDAKEEDLYSADTQQLNQDEKVQEKSQGLLEKRKIVRELPTEEMFLNEDIELTTENCHFEVQEDGNIIKRLGNVKYAYEDSVNIIELSIDELLNKIDDNIENEEAIQSTNSSVELGMSKKELQGWKQKVDAYVETQQEEQDKQPKLLGTKAMFDKDQKTAGSANKIYKKKQDYVDRYYDRTDAIFAERAKLRELGLPYDETFEDEYIINAIAKFLSIVSVGSGVLSLSNIQEGLMDIASGDIGLSQALILGGIMSFVACDLIARKNDLKYRKAVYCLTHTYLDSRGGFDEDTIKQIMEVDDRKLPDKYDLACMLEEDRERILSQAENPNKLSKRKKIKRIYSAIKYYENENHYKNRFIEEFIR